MFVSTSTLTRYVSRRALHISGNLYVGFRYFQRDNGHVGASPAEDLHYGSEVLYIEGMMEVLKFGRGRVSSGTCRILRADCCHLCDVRARQSTGVVGFKSVQNATEKSLEIDTP